MGKSLASRNGANSPLSKSIGVQWINRCGVVPTLGLPDLLMTRITRRSSTDQRDLKILSKTSACKWRKTSPPLRSTMAMAWGLCARVNID